MRILSQPHLEIHIEPPGNRANIIITADETNILPRADQQTLRSWSDITGYAQGFDETKSEIMGLII